jgi:hypothetical protein
VGTNYFTTNGLYGYGNVSMFMMFKVFFLEVRIVSDDYFFILKKELDEL